MNIKLDEGAVVPTRAHPEDAGLDIYSMETTMIYKGEYETFRTGLHVEIPHGTFGAVTGRSGLMFKDGITCGLGIIDEGYTGEIKVVLFNHGDQGYLIRKGDKIAQLLIIPVIRPDINVVDQLGETNRGSNGFRSSGK